MGFISISSLGYWARKSSMSSLAIQIVKKHFQDVSPKSM